MFTTIVIAILQDYVSRDWVYREIRDCNGERDETR